MDYYHQPDDLQKKRQNMPIKNQQYRPPHSATRNKSSKGPLLKKGKNTTKKQSSPKILGMLLLAWSLFLENQISSC